MEPLSFTTCEIVPLAATTVTALFSLAVLVAMPFGWLQRPPWQAGR